MTVFALAPALLSMMTPVQQITQNYALIAAHIKTKDNNIMMFCLTVMDLIWVVDTQQEGPCRVYMLLAEGDERYMHIILPHNIIRKLMTIKDSSVPTIISHIPCKVISIRLLVLHIPWIRQDKSICFVIQRATHLNLPSYFTEASVIINFSCLSIWDFDWKDEEDDQKWGNKIILTFKRGLEMHESCTWGYLKPSDEKYTLWDDNGNGSWKQVRTSQFNSKKVIFQVEALVNDAFLSVIFKDPYRIGVSRQLEVLRSLLARGGHTHTQKMGDGGRWIWRRDDFARLSDD